MTSKSIAALPRHLCLLTLSLAVCPLYAQAPVSVEINDNASRVLGHPNRNLVTAAPNWLEGRELTTPQGLAFDRTAAGPILYVADTGNNRVLAWRNPLGAVNGATADLVIGQRTRFTSARNGPGTDFTVGLASPTGLAVDNDGNLWVVDTNNNRVLRYPRPFEQPVDFLFPDVILGQETFGSQSSNTVGRLPNRGRVVPSANTLFLSDLGQNVLRTRIGFDAQGNLWICDSGNHRVLRYPARVLVSGSFGPDADLVLGQLDFVSNRRWDGDAREKLQLNTPSGLHWAPDGRLYVTDSRNRVLVYRNPSNNAQQAERVLGFLIVAPGQPTPQPVNDTNLRTPESVFVLDGTPYVVDTGNNRILRFPSPDTWAPESLTFFSPPARDVIGQDNFNGGDTNRGGAGPTSFSLNQPVDAAVLNNNLFVVDADNNRVVVIPGGAPFNQPANKVFGQILFDANSPNLIEGREFFFIGSLLGVTYRGGGMALDGNILYVADTLNNRVLGFRDIRAISLGRPADLIIGQVSPDRSLPNSPNGRTTSPSQEGLYLPHSVAVDAQGNLFVADSGNGRVLRFPRPFDTPGPQRANLVLGQPNFALKITDPTPRNMSFPVGLAFTNNGSLLVSDLLHNRVLYFIRPNGGDFTNFQAAANVFGQPDFVTSFGSGAGNRLNAPRGIAVDVDDRLYVADSQNNRVQIYNRVPLAGPDASPALTLSGLSSPSSVTADPRTAEIWVANTGQSLAVRFPAFANLSINPRSNLVLTSPVGVLDIRIDQNSNVVISDSTNRVGFYYRVASPINGANFQTTTLAPNTIASIFAQGGAFADSEGVFSSLPLPKVLADTEVLLNEKAVPLFFVGPGQINFFVPGDVATNGQLELLVVRKSNGQVIASGSVQMDTGSPGLFTATSTGQGQVAAINQDGTVNTPANPIARGQVISLFGTGLGRVSNAPTDGDPAPTSPLAEGTRPDVSFNLLANVKPEDISFSGLAPGFVGLWQINVKIPDTVPPGAAVPVLVFLNSSPNRRGTPVTIAVKQ